jgi:PAS domain S-box-containing protein
MNKISNSQPRILIVDDDAVIRESVAVYLEDSGFEVLEAKDGFTGLDMTRRERPDLLLLDLRMPGLDGLEVLAEVNRELQDLPVIVITGVGVLQDAVSAIRHGAFDFITKPIADMAVLEHSINNALEQVRLRQENRSYRNHLEQEVATQTQALQERSRELEQANQRLTHEVRQRKSSEEALKRSEEQLREVINFFEGFIFTADSKGRILFQNEKLKLHCGMSSGQSRCHELICDQPEPCSWCRREEVFQGRTVRTEFFNPKDQRWFHAIHSPLHDGQGRVTRTQTVMIDITERKKAENSLKQSEVKWKRQSRRLQSFMRDATRFMNIVGKSEAMHQVFEAMLQAANSNAHVIIYGESGTGKELVADTIHKLSDRGDRPFVTVHCGALPENLIESEFFGYVKGAFTGAQADRPGYLKAADGGTLFMDEVGELNPSMQVKLLRAIEGQGYTPLGSSEVRQADLRIIAATNKDLSQLLQSGHVRKDFFYRIHVIPITLPPLRERPEDIPLLIHHFLQQSSKGSAPATLSPSVVKTMLKHDWPGNVRELQNTIHRYLALERIDFLDAEAHPASEAPQVPEEGPPAAGSLHEVLLAREREHIEQVLRSNKWHRSRAAEMLGIDRRTLFRKMKTHGLC